VPDLRQAARLVAAAYTILEHQQPEAAALAGEASQLVAAARAFLKTAGLARLLAAGAPSATGDHADAARDAPSANLDLTAVQGSSLTQAYAAAATAWARCLSIAEALGEAFITERDWDRAQRIAAALEDIGEAAASKRLQRGLRAGHIAEQRQRLAYVNTEMDKPRTVRALQDVRAALEALRGAGPYAMAILTQPLTSINVCIGKLVPSSGGPPVRFYLDATRPAVGEVTAYLGVLEAYLPALTAEGARNYG
jgi:phosphoglycolate phosphatase-like HAD superfamily hydrolase